MKRHLGVPLASLLVLVFLSACSANPVAGDGETRKYKVVVAVKDISKGEMIAPEFLAEREIGSDQVPEDAVTHLAIGAGHFAKTNIKQGDVLLNAQLMSIREQIQLEPQSEHGPK